MKKTCSGCGYYVSTNYFYGECHCGSKIDYKWVKSYCDNYKVKKFKERKVEEWDLMGQMRQMGGMK